MDAAKEELKKNGNGKKTYQAFKALKSQFRTTWMKHVNEPKSGENDKDVIDRVCREVWAERRNNELRKKLKDPTATVQECPALFVPLERATFEVFWKHPLLHWPKSSFEENDKGIFKHKPSIVTGVMSCSQQRNLKKQKTNNNNENAPNKEQMAQAEKNRIKLNRQNRIQIAWMLKDRDNEKYLKILDKLANEVTNNNNNNDNNNDNDNNNSDDSSFTE